MTFAAARNVLELSRELLEAPLPSGQAELARHSDEVMSRALLPYGFFMNWFGKQAGEGIEYHLFAIGLALTVMIGGSGALSFDRALTGDDR